MFWTQVWAGVALATSASGLVLLAWYVTKDDSGD